jgi:predicted transcriptional regulator of viral defense system
MAERLANPGAPISIRRTKLAAATLAALEKYGKPVVTPYDLFQLIRKLFNPQNRKILHLRHEAPGSDDLRKITANLFKTGGLEIDPDYGRSVYRVMSVGNAAADEVTALANPFGHISHLSAMQRWGLTERRPDALHLTMPPANTTALSIQAQMAADYGTADFGFLPKLRFIRHPKMVRGRAISVYETRRPAKWIQVQDSHARLATVGQTFVDTVERPQYCGGMSHVIDVWREHALLFREEIIGAMDSVGTPIAKVRAGYLLDEMLEIGNDPRVQSWVQFAQRGSSRVLDPAKEFATSHSEKWMLSLNV